MQRQKMSSLITIAFDNTLVMIEFIEEIVNTVLLEKL